MNHIRLGRLAFITLVLAATMQARADTATSRIEDQVILSKCFARARVPIDPSRRLTVYLPPGYETSSQRYPVIYFVPNSLDRSYRSCFDDHQAQSVFDGAIKRNAIGAFILVAMDMSTPYGSSWGVNSPATGNWEDYFIGELVPYLDAHYRTLASRNSRGIAGVGMGGNIAIRLATRHPEIFGSVYGLHPVGTGSGVQMMYIRPNWDLLWAAKVADDVKADGFSTIFASIFQAFLPDSEKPPLFVDLPARRVNGALVIDAKLTDRLRKGFFLEEMIPEYAEKLKSLRGFKFDWARSDSIWDHVYSNQAYTHKLNEYGIVHEAEEYNGAWGEPNWGRDGRIVMDVLPFFEHTLDFEAAGGP